MAENLGVVGPLMDIKEFDFLILIEEKLLALEQSGEIEGLKAQFLDRARQYLKRPPPVLNIFKTVNPRRFSFDPSIRYPANLRDDKGEIFYLKNTRFNPLETLSFSQALLFLDGDDRQQLDWALKFEQTQKIEALWILINGPVFELMARLNRVIYFDQGGKLVEKFGIQQVPAVVRQEAKQFVVEELKLPDTIKEKN